MRALLLLVVVGCAPATGPAGTLRFHDRPAAQLVGDRHDIKKPKDRPFARAFEMFDTFLGARVPRMMELPLAAYAGDVNALDDVPDSTWFTNRIGVREVAIDELRTAGRGELPAPKGPWTITGTKVGGASPGFIVKDGNGKKFIMKFDTPGQPDMQTAADVVGQKLLWAAGYNTPDDAILTLKRTELKLSPTAKVEDVFGNKKPMGERDVDAVFALVDQEQGAYRILVSRFLDGEPVGGYAQVGVRDDDPNDAIRHEDRRTLRAQRLFYAWIGSTDVKEDNGLDMWVKDGASHYLVHYLVDFGLSLGVYGYDQRDPADQRQYWADPFVAMKSVLSLGVWKRGWEGADGAPLRGVGRFDSLHYDPLKWLQRYPYFPFDRVDAGDAFWAARIIMRFTDAQLRAAVEEGHYADPRAVDYLTRILGERARQTAAAYLELASPLEHFEVGATGVCFSDLTRTLFADVVATTYVARSYDRDGKALGEAKSDSPTARACVQVPLATGYTIVNVSAVRDGVTLPPVHLHLDGADHHVIGLRRGEP